MPVFGHRPGEACPLIGESFKEICLTQRPTPIFAECVSRKTLRISFRYRERRRNERPGAHFRRAASSVHIRLRDTARRFHVPPDASLPITLLPLMPMRTPAPRRTYDRTWEKSWRRQTAWSDPRYRGRRFFLPRWTSLNQTPMRGIRLPRLLPPPRLLRITSTTMRNQRSTLPQQLPGPEALAVRVPPPSRPAQQRRPTAGDQAPLLRRKARRPPIRW